MPSSHTQGQAIVLGGSIAGLMAARVLFDRPGRGGADPAQTGTLPETQLADTPRGG